MQSSSVLIELLLNTFLLIATATLLSVILPHSNKKTKRFWLFLFFSLTSLASIALPLSISDTIFLDLRVIPLAIAALFEGIIFGSLCALAPLAFSLIFNGEATVANVSMIAYGVIIGGAMKHYLPQPIRCRAVWQFLLCGCAIAISTSISLLLIPQQLHHIILSNEFFISLFIVYASCTTILGLLYQREYVRQEDIARLKKSENRFRLLFSTMNEGFMHAKIIYDAKATAVDWIFLETNTAFDNQLAIAGDSAKGKQFSTFLPQEYTFSPLLLEKAGEVCANGIAQIYQYHSAALQEWFLIKTFSPSAGEFASTFTNITERKKTERSLKTSQSLFSTISRVVPGVIFQLVLNNDMHFEFNFISSRAQDIFGISQRNLKNWSSLSVFHPQERDRVRRTLFAAREQLGDWKIETRLRNNQNQEFWVEIASSCFKSKGTVIFSGVILDCTERIKFQKKLIAREKQYRMLFDNMAEGFALHEIITDQNGVPVDYRFLAVNKQFEHYTGLRANEVLGKQVKTVLPGTEASWIEKYGNVALHGGSIHFENYSEDLDKTFSVTAFQAEPGKFGVIFVDISEHKHLQEQIRQNEKMQSIGQLAGGIAHDFNNILGGVIGNAELAQMNLESQEIVKQNLHNILLASLRAKKLVAQILAFSRKDTSGISHSDIGECIREIIDLLHATIPANIKLAAKIPGQRVYVKFDSTMVHEIIMNLVSNGIDAISRGGTLTIILEKIKTTHSQNGVFGPIAPGLYAKLTIHDSGEGIPSRIRQKIFDPFFTTKPQGKGTGMGLSVVAGHMRSHSGNLLLQSSNAQGTTWQLFFPSSSSAFLSEPVVSTQNNIFIGNGQKVLLVDDEPQLAEVGGALLKTIGFTPIFTTDPAEAKQLLEQDPEICLLITDQSMPGMNGIELAQQVQHIRSELPIILCTGYSTEESKNAARHSGIAHFAQKPLSLQELSTLCSQALHLQHHAS